MCKLQKYDYSVCLNVTLIMTCLALLPYYMTLFYISHDHINIQPKYLSCFIFCNGFFY